MMKQLQKRYWVFASAEYECGLGMSDFTESFRTLAAAQDFAITHGEWSAIFDSHKGKQINYFSGIREPKKERVLAKEG